ncbi:S1/P1 nuclease [Mucilaginibacter sp. BT774]|uniref:S1/P1 nuclease n=1 Tax=Mucilaginibacter sp. BT774 TaxID=3062276 RepID=UPI0026770956|nr:S1/P1 nuclease [Mucilaginibacter sp. BT774]MDO3627543.1 S1/P1 nuclease [Mucilaginibacter sp. BT774]
MKRYICLSIAAIWSMTLISWGFKGHKAVATIAEYHLNKNVKDAIDVLLDKQPMGDVASWADEVRNDPKYKYTASWHFLNLPLGLNRQQFEQAVINQQQPNIYTAIMNCEAVIANVHEPDQNKKQEALKFLIHLVGDAHQPMHISRAEDKGGNTIQVRFDDKGTNLHSIWDSRLIDHEGLSDTQMVKEYDTASPGQIKAWQNDSPVQWLWESYQISTKLYAEAEKTNKLDDEYYRTHIGIVHERIDRAGIRLAGLLNKLFDGVQTKKVVLTRVVLTPPPGAHHWGDHVRAVGLDELSKHIGDTVKVNEKVYGSKDIGGMMLIDLGAEYPNQKLTVVLKGMALQFFNALVEQHGQGKNASQYLKDKTLAAIGHLVIYKGRPEIVITDPNGFILEP